MFDAHGTELRLTFPPKVQVASYTVFGLAVRDIGASVASLSAKKVVFERYGFLNQTENGVMVFPNGDKVAWFKDPDGNLLSLTQFPSGKHEDFHHCQMPVRCIRSADVIDHFLVVNPRVRTTEILSSTAIPIIVAPHLMRGLAFLLGVVRKIAQPRVKHGATAAIMLCCAPFE